MAAGEYIDAEVESEAQHATQQPHEHGAASSGQGTGVPPSGSRELAVYVPEKIDPNEFLRDGYREAVVRSRRIRSDLYELAPAAMKVIKDVLEEGTTDENRKDKLKAAQYVLTASIVALPDISYKQVEMTDSREKVHEMDPASDFVPVTRAEILEIAAVAMQAQDHRGEKQPEDGGER